jgi:serine phosphatase RsbU (regulator of sigma subunit)
MKLMNRCARIIEAVKLILEGLKVPTIMEPREITKALGQEADSEATFRLSKLVARATLDNKRKLLLKRKANQDHRVENPIRVRLTLNFLRESISHRLLLEHKELGS